MNYDYNATEQQPQMLQPYYSQQNVYAPNAPIPQMQQMQQMQQQQQPPVQYVFVSSPPQTHPIEGAYLITQALPEDSPLVHEEEFTVCCGAKKRTRNIKLAKTFGTFTAALACSSGLTALCAYTFLYIVYYLTLIFFFFFAAFIFFLLLLFFRKKYPLNLVLLCIYAFFFGIALGCPVYLNVTVFLFVPLSCCAFAFEMTISYLVFTKDVSVLYGVVFGCLNTLIFYMTFFFVNLYDFNGLIFVAVVISLALNFCMVGFTQELPMK